MLTRWPIELRHWLGSATLLGLMLEAEGLFVRMCLDQWEHGACRPEEAFWKAAHGHRSHSWSSAWLSCRSLFVERPEGLVHPRVARDRERALREIEAKVDGGRKGNRARWERGKADSGGGGRVSDRSATGDPSLTRLSASASASVVKTPQPPAGGGFSLEEIPPGLRTDEFLGLWRRWCAHRAQRRAEDPRAAAWTPAVRQRQLERLEKVGAAGACGRLDVALTSGWAQLWKPNMREPAAPPAPPPDPVPEWKREGFPNRAAWSAHWDQVHRNRPQLARGARAGDP